jgi:hypothetical protein
VKVDGRLYVWTGEPDPELALREARAALEKLTTGRVAAAKKAELAGVVRAAFRFATDPMPPPAAAAPTAVAGPVREPAPVRKAKGATIDAGRLADLSRRCEELERQLYAADTRSPEVRRAQERQLRIDAIRAFAELAMEIEELTANEAEPNVLVERVRARATREGLEPIGRAGEETSFDRSRHKPIGGGLRDGAAVYVVRPGYTWHAPDEDVLIGKAVVEE